MTATGMFSSIAVMTILSAGGSHASTGDFDAKGRPIVAVTGMGAITPLGLNAPATWSGMRDARSGIELITRFDTTDCPVKVAGQVDFEYPINDRAFKRSLSETGKLAMAASEEAIGQAKLLTLDATGQAIIVPAEAPGCPEYFKTQGIALTRAGTYIGSCMGETQVLADAAAELAHKGSMSPFTNVRMLQNMPAWAVGARFGFQGELLAPGGACASSLNAIGLGMRAIRTGALDLAIVGGADLSVTRLNLQSYLAANALQAGFEDAPSKACQPWNAGRKGFVMSDGAGVLVLERLDHAFARGLREKDILALAVGYGASSDGYHPTKPRRDGSGNALAQINALHDAGIEPQNIDLVYAHATGTPLGDCLELRGLEKTWAHFNQRLTPSTPIYAPKSVLGHTLGASGVLASQGVIASLKEQIVPQTLNFESFDVQGEPFSYINLSTDGPQILNNAQYGMVNALGFGGTNAAVVFRKYNSDMRYSQ